MNRRNLVSQGVVVPTRLFKIAAQISQKWLSFVVVIGFTAGLAFLVPTEILSRASFAACAAFVFLLGFGVLLDRLGHKIREASLEAVTATLNNDTAPSFVADGEGTVLSRNPAAEKRFSRALTDSLAESLKEVLANPSAVMFRLQTKALAKGAASEDVVTRAGHLRISVHKMDEDSLIWRVEDHALAGPDASGRDKQTLPSVTLGRTGAILFMNDAARALVGERVKTLDRLFVDPEVAHGKISTLTTKDGAVRTLIAETDGGAGRRTLFLLPAPEDGETVQTDWASFEDLPVPLLKIDTDGCIETSNRMAVKLLGGPVETGTHLGDLMEGLGRAISDWITDTIKERNPQASEFLRLKRRDKEVFVQVTLNRISDGEGQSLIAVLNDATELKTLEAQFVQSQKMQAIGQLAGGVAHDFNNLLTAISGHCDLLLLRHDQGDADYSDLVQINQNANRAAALVGQLLAFSRKQTLRPEVLDMRDTLSDLPHLLNRLVGEKVTLPLVHDPVLPSIRADKRQLEQVVMNLVVNGRDAMPAGGEIKIETSVETLSEPMERDRAIVPADRFVVVKITDHGGGIESDQLQKVFEPFYTTKRTGEGTGLGLSTAYGIIKQSGGYIFVDSVVGSGTCFTIYLPVYDKVEDKPLAISKAIQSLPQPKGEGVVLLVEDEAPVRAFASRALRLRGYTVLEADSAEEALKTLEDETLKVDVFVTDVVMPGMDGPSWVKLALKDRPDTRVVFVSGYAEESFSEDQMRIPNSVFLPKPFSLSELTETVHQQLS
jgi:two-component system cell cycle sensor histidine kinase/response regulator CckA